CPTPPRCGVGAAIIGGDGIVRDGGGSAAGGGAGNQADRAASRVNAVTKWARASGSESPRGAKAWRSRKKPVSTKASTRSPGDGGAVSPPWRKNTGSRISL